jgi:Chaperone for flagella basal body P-ring formation
MGGRGYFVAGLATVLSCFAAWRPALAQSPASSLQRKVAVAVARDLQFDSEGQASRLQILAPPAMSPPARADLHVVLVRAGFSPGSWLVRMACAARSDCLPFHVVLRSTSSERLQSGCSTGGAGLQAHVPEQQEKSLQPLRSMTSVAEAGNCGGGLKVGLKARTTHTTGYTNPGTDLLARSGDRMLLVEERPGMRLQAKVVCLESGVLGDAIHVRNLATHRVLLATIAGKNEVRVE